MITSIAVEMPAGKPLVLDYAQAYAHVSALTGDNPDTCIIDVRIIHELDKGRPSIVRRGLLQQLWNEICSFNKQGYGVFINISDMDGMGLTIANVKSVRVQAIDLDNVSAQSSFELANGWFPKPAFGVQTSPGRFHVYWKILPHRDLDRFTATQRKLRQLFDGDPKICDPTRVLRLAGTFHRKNPEQPHLVTCFALSGTGYVTTADQLDQALASVNVIEGGNGQRHELGDPELAAPSLEELQRALDLTDPNRLNRGEWIAFTAAFKQAGWTLASEQALFDLWSAWCVKYERDDVSEDHKQWGSIRNTELGWQSIVRRVPGLHAQLTLGSVGNVPAQPQPSPNVPQTPNAAPQFGELLTPQEQQQWFQSCVLIGPENRIIGPRGIRYDVGSFNASYGGKRFIIDTQGKVTDEPWKAATRSTVWTVPKVDGTCFRPDLPTGAFIHDGLGRSYVNTYVPAKIETLAGDPSPFLRHLELVLPVESDRNILLAFMAHNARFPGFKIPWAPVIQSAEGVGKNVFKQVMRNAIDKQYFYQPKAKQLNDSGSKFNGWMDGKLFFLVDEIKTDERRDMVETLKPFVTETELEIEGKGVNQKMADTPSNWLFFSNYKDAIPITANGRRFAIFYSPIQTVDDLRLRGMDDTYFNNLYNWLGDHQNGGHKMGLRIVAHYLLNYPIERGAIPKRAPATNSTAEALIESRGWLEQFLAEAVEDSLPGFRGGWISTAAVGRLLGQRGIKPVPAKTLGTAIAALKYSRIAQAGRAYFQDDPNKRGVLWNLDAKSNVENYGPAQGYE
ncbi:DUF5906 domain-containing protein [Mesorhizobium sp. Cs1299R1N1]|uniref:DUF5906 domain-containing protein n=1 Tax=Mesorhizobium sp. Cs1299R1N1 TaxID=3015172 RepID=UPI00301B875E